MAMRSLPKGINDWFVRVAEEPETPSARVVLEVVYRDRYDDRVDDRPLRAVAVMGQ
jgi:hypothetical protein